MALPLENVALREPVLFLQLFACAEQVRIARHVKESLFERNAPRVFAGGVIDQHWHSPVDSPSNLSIPAGAKDRAGAGIGVDQCNVFGREREVSANIAELFGVMGEKHE